MSEILFLISLSISFHFISFLFYCLFAYLSCSMSIEKKNCQTTVKLWELDVNKCKINMHNIGHVKLTADSVRQNTFFKEQFNSEIRQCQ